MSDQRSPLFIVGASRSGTAMMRSILNNHPEILISGESHYFDDLRIRMKALAQSPLSDTERAECEDYFLALDHRPYGHQGMPTHSDTSREELRAAAEERGVGTDAYFEAFCVLRARRAGKTIWGDKTPRHVFRIPEILERYPKAQIICMVRDARAVVASYRDWKNQGGFDLENDPTHADALKIEEARARRSYNPILMSLIWRSTVRAAVVFQRRYGENRVRIQQYEQIIKDPERTIRDLTDWLGVEFSPRMLDVPMHNSSFSKYQALGGLSTEPLSRWRTKLSVREIAVIQSSCSRELRARGYVPDPIRLSILILLVEWIKLPFAIARATAANKRRMGSVPRYLWRRMRMVVARA